MKIKYYVKYSSNFLFNAILHSQFINKTVKIIALLQLSKLNKKDIGKENEKKPYFLISDFYIIKISIISLEKQYIRSKN